MNSINDARDILSDSLKQFSSYFKRVNDWIGSTNKYQYPSIFPDVTPQGLLDLAADIHSSNNTNFTNIEFLEYVKNDFGDIGPKKGHIEFKSLTALIQNNPNYISGSGTNQTLKPVVLFTWPPEKADDSTNNMLNWGWGVDFLIELAAFSFHYDFIKYHPDYYQFIFKNLKIALVFKSIDLTNPNHNKLQTVWKTPPITMNVEVRIPKNLAVAVTLPDITFEFFNFIINLNPNFNWTNLSFSPLRLNLPDFLNWPFDPINIGDFLKLNLDCGFTIGLLLPDGPRFKLNIDWGEIKLPLLNLLDWLGFPPSSPWPSLPDIDYFTEVQPQEGFPDWAAIYFDVSALTKVLGDFAPEKLFLLLGVNTGGQVKAGFLTCTGKIIQDKAFMLRTALQYDFELQESNGSELSAHPGFSLEILSDQNAKNLANSITCLTPLAAEVSFGSFSAKIDRLGIQWDKDEKAYICYADGEFTIKELLRSKDPTSPDDDLKLPFKGLGFTTDGKLVLKKTWITLKEAQQVKLDGIDAIQLFLKAYGYAKETDGGFWIGFSGDVKLPVLNVTAGVDHLIFWSDGNVELSGVYIDTEIAKVLSVTGAAKWGSGLIPPHLKDTGTTVSGFAGLLKIGINAGNINLGLMLSFTYVKIVLSPNGDIIAWSFAGEVVMPTPIELGCGFGIKSLGLMIGQNYIPLPKQQSLPYDQWLEAGLNGDVENILDVVNYWSPTQEAFAAGFSIGISTTMDNGFILRAKAILVLVIPGPLIAIAGKADVLRKPESKLVGIFNLLIIYDHNDPGILASLSFRYQVKYLVDIYGMAEIYFDFDVPNRWHFYLGTPAKPVTAKALGIFEAGAYLTIDASKLAVGVKVFYGYDWDIGPLYIKAYIAFSGELLISWNPIYIQVTILLIGELAARIFGFGLSAAIKADLLIKSATPWYLYASAEVKFTISFLFFSWSWTGSLSFSWGDDSLPAPDVVLPKLFEDDRRCKALSSSLRLYTNLTPDNYTPQGNPSKRYIAMDGVLGLEFNRDIEFVLDQSSGDLLEGTINQIIEDEKSPNSGNYQYFHGRVTGFKIEKSANGSAFSPITKPVYFVWTPTDEDERKRQVTRDFDLGYFQFRLNDDPNTHVKLTCPDLFQADPPLEFDTENPDLRGTFSFTGALEFELRVPWLNVKLSKDQTGTGPDAYKIDYQHFGARLYTNGVIPFEAGSSGKQAIAMQDDMTLELDVPSACIFLLYESRTSSAAGATPAIKDLLTLYDENGTDITDLCDNKIFPTGGPYVLILNDFDKAQNPQQRIYSTQDTPSVGVKKIIFKETGRIWYMEKPGAFFTLFPLNAIKDIYKRNLERVRQMAKLEYTFDQTQDPGKILWEPSDYQLKVNTDWSVNLNQNAELKNFTEKFSVIKPFEHEIIVDTEGQEKVQLIQVEVNEEQLEVQPFEPYLRRMIPASGARPVYRDQFPTVTYNCNYINAMLKEGKRYLTMILLDTDNNPCKYTKLIADTVDIDVILADEFIDMTRNFGFSRYRDIEEVMEKIPVDIPGVDPSLFEEVLGSEVSANLLKTNDTEGLETPQTQIHMFITTTNTMLNEARLHRINRLTYEDIEARKRASSLEKKFTSRFTESDEKVLVLMVADQIKVTRLRYVTRIVEYHYTNNDLKLDVSNLQLSDCLSGQPLELNAYERGFFAPVIPQDAYWSGLKPNTSYRAEIYCLDDDDEIQNTLPNAPVLHSISFTTSSYKDIEEIGKTFTNVKVREVDIRKNIYNNVLSNLTDDLLHFKFKHPDDPQVIKFDFGLDIYRQLDKEPVISATDSILPRELEEKHLRLWELERKEIEKTRQSEGMVFEELFNEDVLNLKPDPLPDEGVKVTWLRTIESANQTKGTLGVLIDFSEPVDWERTGILVKEFKSNVMGETKEIDLLNPPQNNSSYEVKMHWVRSLDGARLLLIPQLIRTRTYNPYIVLAAEELEILEMREALSEEKLSMDDTTISDVALRRKKFLPIEGSNSEIEMSETSPNGEESTNPEERIFIRPEFIGDYAIAATPRVFDAMEIERIHETFGKTSIANISNYQINKLDLEFYYLSENYEKKNRNFRAIPRLDFRDGQPGDQKGYIGTLKL